VAGFEFVAVHHLSKVATAVAGQREGIDEVKHVWPLAVVDEATPAFRNEIVPSPTAGPGFFAVSDRPSTS